MEGFDWKTLYWPAFYLTAAVIGMMAASAAYQFTHGHYGWAVVDLILFVLNCWNFIKLAKHLHDYV